MPSKISESRPLPFFQVKDATKDGFIAGYGSIFGVPDLGGDVVAPGAFSRSLASGEMPLMLWQHDPSRPIGRWVKAREDERGLYLEGNLNTEVQDGREALAMINHGDISGLSIGFKIAESDFDRASGTRVLRELDLWEVSLVSFPMNRNAQVSEPRIFKSEVDLEKSFRKEFGIPRGAAKKMAAASWRHLIGEGHGIRERDFDAVVKSIRGCADFFEKQCRKAQ